METNIVSVYRIETQNYVTTSEVLGGRWETFEINHTDDFHAFNHKERQSIEGKGLLINQDGINEIVEEINKHIQKNRDLNGLGDHQDPVHLVTSEFAAGTLKVGLERPKTVIGFPDSFSIGPLWKLDEKLGQRFRNEWLVENINFEQDDYVYENKITNTLRQIEDIVDHVPIYIWYGNNADEQIGLRYLLYLLREKTNEIFLMNSTEFEQHIFHTGQIDSSDIKTIYENNKDNKPLSERQGIQFHKEWENLSKTKDVLRLWIEEEIKAVPEDHFDSLILETIEKLQQIQGTNDFIKTGNVIGELVTQKDTQIDYYFSEYRIRHLIYCGVLDIKGIPKSMWHYSIKLR